MNPLVQRCVCARSDEHEPSVRFVLPFCCVASKGGGFLCRAHRSVYIQQQGIFRTVSFGVGPTLLLPGFVSDELVIKRPCADRGCALPHDRHRQVGIAYISGRQRLSPRSTMPVRAMADVSYRAPCLTPKAPSTISHRFYTIPIALLLCLGTIDIQGRSGALRRHTVASRLRRAPREPAGARPEEAPEPRRRADDGGRA